MQEYVINVSEIEELQTLEDLRSLESIFEKAKSTIVNGEKVLLARRLANGTLQQFDQLTTENELSIYKDSVFKYL